MSGFGPADDIFFRGPDDPTVPRVIVPYVKGRLDLAVLEEIARQQIEPELVEMIDNLHYWRLVSMAWYDGPFILVEHDVVPLDLRALWTCPAPWCGYAYLLGVDERGKRIHTTGFGVTCCKLIRDVLPDVWGDDPMDYHGLDSHLAHHAYVLGIQQHRHEGIAHHVSPGLPHTANQEPAARRRQQRQYLGLVDMIARAGRP